MKHNPKQILEDLERVYGGEIDINHIDDDGYSLIERLIIFGYPKIATCHIKDADPNRVNPDDDSLLNVAIICEEEIIAQKLIDMGASIDDQTLILALKGDFEEFILDNFTLSDFSRNNSEFITEAFIHDHTQVLQELLRLNFAIDPDILSNAIRRINHSRKLQDLAIEIFNRIEVSNLNQILNVAIRNDFELLAILILEKYPIDLQQGLYLFDACKKNMIKLVIALIKHGHKFSASIITLSLSSNLQRVLSDAYPEYPVQFVSKLDQINSISKSDRKRIETFITTIKANINSHIPPEIYELIIDQMNIPISSEPKFYNEDGRIYLYHPRH